MSRNVDARTIFGVQTTATLVTYALIAWWHLWPRLVRLARPDALVTLLWIHTLRTLGLTVLVPGVTDPRLPSDFAVPLAYGDLVAALLAFLAIIALRAGWPFALALVWIFNIEGTLDLVNVTVQGIAADATRYQLGAAWLIPTFFVPALWVSHVLVFVLLLRKSAASEPRVAVRP